MTSQEIAALIPDEKQRAVVLAALGNEWVPKADFTRATQAKADELKVAQDLAAAGQAEIKRFSAWYYGQYEPWRAQVLAESEKRAAAPTNPNSTPANPNGNWWENWDVLTPQQQAQMLEQRGQQQVIDYANKVAQTYGQEFQKALQGLSQQVQEGEVCRRPEESQECNVLSKQGKVRF